ncbi:excinuclease ABC subunit UvrA [uncultured Serinicoccus sp.]|uniref:excinuclease ABC subunit UvrA n=1 Tax=uncultured Serinicoccus sp. TaxID=735514 RepID=UPI002633A136|nr:excinuclease ABC subunit UvrA [uncultured Serinicoccus sp.]
MHPADSHDVIRVRGARVNNLRDVDVDIPKRRLTVFSGVSGSGKSSLVFGTVAAESQRLINETYSAFLQSFMPVTSRPEVEELDGLSAAIVVDQERLGANARSTVGTATDAYALLRILFSRLSEPHVGPSSAFSFNLASASGSGRVVVDKDGKPPKGEAATFEFIGGMCPVCEGLGTRAAIDEDVVVDRSKSLNEGAILVPGYGVGTWGWKMYGDEGAAADGKLDMDTVLADYSEREWHWLMYQEPTKVKFAGVNLTYEGLVVRIRRTLFGDREPKQKHMIEFKERVATTGPCTECGGTRLNEAARTATVDGTTISECTAMQVNDLAGWVRGIDDTSVQPLVANLAAMLGSFTEIGLGYLSLDREAGTLSGGEAQRVKMIRQLGSALTDVTYVFDEPTVGLHPHDVRRMIALLSSLRDKGNTILVVEHKPEVIEAADHVIDIGPGAGSDGGTITFEGDVAGLRGSDTVTGHYLDHRMPLRSEEAVRTPTGRIEIRGASTHNLQDVDVDLPTGVLVAVTGVAGSGKSSLVHGSLGGREDVLIVDQSAIRGSRRSNPATYSGLLDPIRTAFAKENDVSASLFSPNSEGACPACNGQGVIYPEQGMLVGGPSRCETCGGQRFRDDVLVHTLHGLTIAEVFELSIARAAEVFTTGKARGILARLVDVGLGYLRLGQPLTTLSGGERQRLKLAAQLGGKGTTIVLDEPTAGLHLADTERLVRMLHTLVDQGHSLVVIEHNLAVVANADWVLDIGPGAGHEGGRVVFEGTPAQMVADGDTLTSEHLREWVGA